ncbi:tRNA (guanosine(46)-N7)-methyltransferase TrmB [Salinisphaera orenii]|uniref:tRNA (guanosine(46)-N7)-methyltransferase TrmB n=1 Tax=Salinisphaera orenii TaxID=856731 RepID=UPI000DBE71AD
MDTTQTTDYRPIRSFTKREGRLTPGQQKKLDQLWPRYGVATPSEPLNWATVFGRNAPITLEIGFGAGEVLATRAPAEPERDFIGIEVYRTGIARLMGALDASGAHNVRLLSGDAVELIDMAFADAALDEVLLYFPDPWPKKRHHKRRIVTSVFAKQIARVLRSGGLWRLATDWPDYAEWMRDLLDVQATFENVGNADGFVTDPPRPATRFEARGERRGHPVYDLAYRRRAKTG